MAEIACTRHQPVHIQPEQRDSCMVPRLLGEGETNRLLRSPLLAEQVQAVAHSHHRLAIEVRHRRARAALSVGVIALVSKTDSVCAAHSAQHVRFGHPVDAEVVAQRTVVVSEIAEIEILVVLGHLLHIVEVQASLHAVLDSTVQRVQTENPHVPMVVTRPQIAVPEKKRRRPRQPAVQKVLRTDGKHLPALFIGLRK